MFLNFLLLYHCHQFLKIIFITTRIVIILSIHIMPSFFEAAILISIINAPALRSSLWRIYHWIMEWVTKNSIGLFELIMKHIRCHLQDLTLVLFDLFFSSISTCKVRSTYITAVITFRCLFKEHSGWMLPSWWIKNLFLLNSKWLVILMWN